MEPIHALMPQDTNLDLGRSKPQLSHGTNTCAHVCLVDWIWIGDTIDQEDIIQRDGDDLSLQRGDSREGRAE